MRKYYIALIIILIIFATLSECRNRDKPIKSSNKSTKKTKTVK